MKHRHPLWHLLLFRVRALVREPTALFWTFAFPLLTALILGLAFRARGLPELTVAVVEGPQAEVFAARLEASADLRAMRLPRAEAFDALRKGQAALVLVPGEPPDIFVDSLQPDGRTARLAVRDVLGQMHGGPERPEVREHPVRASGHRYIDFFIPGMLGYSLMSSGLWSVGMAIVGMRTGKLLRRLSATPMRHGHFLLSFVLWRCVQAVVEILFVLAFSWLVFDVRVSGSLVAFIVFGLMGSLCFGGLALLVASRARNPQMANGLTNLILLPMTILCGVFFPVDRFPAWLRGVARVLPLTALNDGLRGILLDGTPLVLLWRQLLVLSLWCAVSFAVSLRIFRWT
ncbi:MAG TPA: ABC transporter permease [Archangium sp.]|uniref:ABC transporter permease n=1 Tax=Archangium sp. TaxID=1872627 RepID=UPI002E31BFD3|nr:ABC transporter permease [Archangium sp.]HEX5751294.1 ABC transporter permease [Archangium sp.]